MGGSYLLFRSASSSLSKETPDSDTLDHTEVVQFVLILIRCVVVPKAVGARLQSPRRTYIGEIGASVKKIVLTWTLGALVPAANPRGRTRGIQYSRCFWAWKNFSARVVQEISTTDRLDMC